MFMFQDEARLAADALRRGLSVHLVGPIGVGLTTVQRYLSAQMSGEGWNVVSVSGEPWSVQHPFYAVRQALFGEWRHDPYVSAVDDLTETLRSGTRSVVILDDIEHIDEASLGVIQSAVSRWRVPIAIARSIRGPGFIVQNKNWMHQADLRIDVAPLDFVSIAQLLEDRLGGVPTPEVVSRVFVKSSGVTGLVLAIADGARETGALVKRGEHWAVRGDSLWSSSVDFWVESRLAVLTKNEREAVRHIATAHSFTEAGFCEEINPSTLEVLAAKGLLTSPPSASHSGLVLEPTALSEYFRRDAEGQFYRERPDVAVLPTLAFRASAEPPEGITAEIVRRFSERSKRAVLESAHAWSVSPTVSRAIPYLIELYNVPRSDRRVRDVFERTALETSDTAAEATDFVLLRLWAANTYEDPTPYLEELVQLYPGWRGVAKIIAATFGAGVTKPDFSELPAGEGENLARSAYGYAAMLAGRFDEARDWVSASPTSLVSARRFQTLIRAIASESPEQSVQRCLEARSLAEAELDQGAFLLHSYGASLMLIRLGRWREALPLIEQALAFGPPGTPNAGIYRAMLYMASLLAWASGSAAGAELFLAEADTFALKDEALPGMQSAVGASLRLLLDGDLTGAAQEIQQLADVLRSQGNLFAAQSMLVMALTTWPTRGAAAAFVEVSEDIEGESHALPQLVLELLESSRDVRRISRLRAALPFHDVPLAELVARAIAKKEEDSANPGSPRVVSLFTELGFSSDSTGSSAPDARSNREELSQRERQVGLLVSTHTNQQIAQRLNLSVRTVENHLHRAFKKTGARNRDELFQRIL